MAKNGTISKMAIVLQVFMMALYITLISPLILTSGAPEYGRIDFNQCLDPVGTAMHYHLSRCENEAILPLKTSRVPVFAPGCSTQFKTVRGGIAREQTT